MWYLPDDEYKGSDAKADSPHSKALLTEGQSEEELELRRSKLPKFDQEYNKEATLNVPKADEEWPVKSPVLSLEYSYGCDPKRKDNLVALTDGCVAYISSEFIIIYNSFTKHQDILAASYGCVPKQLTVHPAKAFFAVAERGTVAGVNIFEYPSLRLVSRFQCDGDTDIAFVHFNREGSHILTVTPAPHYVLCIWDWENQTALCRGKASTNYPIYRAMFAYSQPGQITTSGIDHIKFWTYLSTDAGWELQCTTGKFGSRATSTIECFVVLALGSIISAASDGTVHKWVSAEIEAEVLRKSDEEHLHDGTITNMALHERNLITMGTDGFIRLWSWDQLEGPSDNREGIFLDVMFELNLGENHVPIHMVPMDTHPGAEPIWLVLDERGIVWTTPFPNTEHESPTELFFMHTGAVNAIATSLDHSLMATGGSDGNIRVYDHREKTCMAVWNAASLDDNTPITALTWLPENLTGHARCLVVGHNEGTLRLLEFPSEKTEESKELQEEEVVSHGHKVPRLTDGSSIRMQIGEVVQIAVNPKTGLLVSLSDLMVLISEVQMPEIAPMALYGVKAPLYLSWKNDSMTALITTGMASVYEVTLPVEKDEASLLDPSKIDEPEEQKRMTSLGNLPTCRVYELKSIKAKLQGLPDPDIPNYIMSRVVWAMYDPSNQDTFWMNTLDADAGYLYLCAFGKEEEEEKDEDEEDDDEEDDEKTEPLNGIRLDPHFDMTAKYLEFLDHGHLAVVGTVDGHLLILLLKENFRLDTIISEWKYRVHNGSITGMRIASDNSHITTVGTDGNILVFQLKVPNTEEAISERRYYKSILHTLQTTQMTTEEDKAFSLFVREDRLLRDQAEQAQEKMRESVRKIRLEVINRIMEDNEKLPEEMRLTKEDFILTPQVRSSVEGDFTRRLKNARDTNIVERVKGRIIEERLIEYVRADTERAPEFRLKSFDGTCHVSTYWVQEIEDNLKQEISQLKVEMERQIQEEKCRAAANADGCPMEFGTFDDQPVEQQVLRKGPATVTNHDQRLSVMGRHTWERLRYAEHLYRTKQRWEQWKRLLDRKPDVSQDGDQILASEKKRISGQEYKIKQKEEYAIQFMAEYLHAPQVQIEFLELRQRVQESKKTFNSRLVDLRAEKVVRIRRYREIVTELAVLQDKLPYSEQVTLDPVDDLDKEEEPESFQKPSREECMEVYNKEEQEKKKKEKPVVRNSLIDDEEHVGLAEDVNSKKPRFARLQSFATRQGRLSLLERPMCEVEPSGPWDELHSEPSPEEEFAEKSRMSLLLYKRDKLVESAKVVLKVFDGKLKLLRHDKFLLGIELKRAELHLLTYQWEYRILKDYDDHEKMLSREEAKLEAKKALLERRLWSLNPSVRALFDRLQHLREREANVKLEFEKYWKTVMQHKPLRRLLYNVFVHKIKGLRLDDGEDEGCAYNPEIEEPAVEVKCSASSMDIRNRANLKRSSLRWKNKLRLGNRGMKKPSLGPSLTDFDPMDVHTCPRGLDNKVFLTVQSLNKQYARLRSLIDEEIDHHHTLLQMHHDTQESLSHVTFELASVSASLHELRLEKFNRWKDIPYPVAVRMDQFRFGSGNVNRSEIYEALIFDERNLQLLRSFIDQVKQETSEDTGQLISLKNQYDKLDREQILFALRTDALRKDCQKLMVEKYGGFIDLDRAEQLRTDAGIESLEDELVKKQKAHDHEMLKLKHDAETLKVELTKTRADTTVYLKSVSSQMAERELLVKRINDRAKKTGRGVLENVTTEGLQTHHEKLLLWQHIAQVQAAEIDSLLTEISFFKSKDSDVGILRSVLDRHIVGNFGDHSGRFPEEKPLPLSAEPLHDKIVAHVHKDPPAEAPPVTISPAAMEEPQEQKVDSDVGLPVEEDLLSSLDFSFISYLPVFADGSFESVVTDTPVEDIAETLDLAPVSEDQPPATADNPDLVPPENQPRVAADIDSPIGYR